MSVDARAVGLGAVVGFLIAFPGAVLGGLTGWAVFAIVVFGGWVGAGFVAGSKRPDAPLSHGILAALVTYAAIQAVGIAIIAAKSDEQHPATWLFNAGVAAGLGLLGGYVSERRAA